MIKRMPNITTKDWTGNSKTTFSIIGASSHSEKQRELNDYYATDPKAMELLLEQERFSHHVWEPACGEGHLSEVLVKHGYDVHSSDIVDRGYGDGCVDFLLYNKRNIDVDIITNPPYKYAVEFVRHALDIVGQGHKVAMFLKLTFLEGQKRRTLFRNTPPKIIYVSSKRILCAPNGDFGLVKSSAVAYAWFVWEKGFTGDPIVKWIN